MNQKQSVYPFNLIADIFKYSPDTAEMLQTGLDTDRQRGLAHAIGTLSERGRAVVEMYYRDGLSPEKIGAQFNVTRERVRQLIAKSVRILRHPSRANYIVNGYAVTSGEIARETAARMQAEVDRVSAQYDEKLIALHAALTRIDELIAKTDAAAAAITAAKDASATVTGNPPIDELNFSVRTYNVLKRAGVNRLQDICAFSIDEIYAMRNMGRKSAEEIVTTIGKYGLALRGDAG